MRSSSSSAPRYSHATSKQAYYVADASSSASHQLTPGELPSRGTVLAFSCTVALAVTHLFVGAYVLALLIGGCRLSRLLPLTPHSYSPSLLALRGFRSML